MEVFNTPLAVLEKACPVKVLLMEFVANEQYRDDPTMEYKKLYDRCVALMPNKSWARSGRIVPAGNLEYWEALVGALNDIFEEKTLNDLMNVLANSKCLLGVTMSNLTCSRYDKAGIIKDGEWRGAYHLAVNFGSGPIRSVNTTNIAAAFDKLAIPKIENKPPSSSQQAASAAMSVDAHTLLNYNTALRNEIVIAIAQLAKSGRFDNVVVGFNEAAGLEFTGDNIVLMKSHTNGIPMQLGERLIDEALERKRFSADQLAGVFDYVQNNVFAQRIRDVANGRVVASVSSAPLTAASLSPMPITPMPITPAAAIPHHAGGFVMTDDAMMADYLLVKRGASGKPEILWQLDKQGGRVVFDSLNAARKFRIFLEKKKALDAGDKWAVLLLLGTSQGEEFIPSEVERVAEIEGEDDDEDESTDDIPTRTVTNLTSAAKPRTQNKIEYIGSDGVVRTAGENHGAFQRYIVASLNPASDHYTFYPAPPGKEPANDAAAELALEVIAEAESKIHPDDVFGLYQVVEQSKEKRSVRTMKRAALVNEPRGAARSAK